MTKDIPNDFISTTEAAKLLGISRVTIFNKIQSGEIKASKVGRNYVIRRTDLPGFNEGELTDEQKRQIEAAVKRTVEEYGETLRMLGNE